jgi:hypothetical protein
MAKFVYIYHGGMAGETKEEQDKSMAAWGKWFDELGDSLADPGNPFGKPTYIMADGVSEDGKGNAPATGYSIINAKDMHEAVRMAKGCPELKDGSKAAVAVYEAFPM